MLIFVSTDWLTDRLTTRVITLPLAALVCVWGNNRLSSVFHQVALSIQRWLLLSSKMKHEELANAVLHLIMSYRGLPDKLSAVSTYTICFLVTFLNVISRNFVQHKQHQHMNLLMLAQTWLKVSYLLTQNNIPLTRSVIRACLLHTEFAQNAGAYTCLYESCQCLWQRIGPCAILLMIFGLLRLQCCLTFNLLSYLLPLRNIAVLVFTIVTLCEIHAAVSCRC